MDGLIKGLLDCALDALHSDAPSAAHNSSDRNSWAEVVSAGSENPPHQQSHDCDEDNRSKWGKNSEVSWNEEGEEKQKWQRQGRHSQNYNSGKEDGQGYQNQGHTSKYKMTKAQKEQFKYSAHEQQFAEPISSSVDTEPTEEELSDTSKACQRLWDLDLNRLTPGKEYAIDCGEGKKVYHKEDMAQNSLFSFVDTNVFKKPTYARFYALLDNYTAEEGVSETSTAVEIQEQLAFIEEISRTAPIQYLYRYLVMKRIVSEDFKEFKRMLQSLWFDLYARGGTRNSSSAFEHVFVGELKRQEEVSGFHNWIQFYIEESKGAVDYQGYILPRSRYGDSPDSNSQLLTVQLEWNGLRKPASTTFIGVSPEFEFALYTLIFFIGEEDNNVYLGPFEVNIKCYRYKGDKIGSIFPIAAN